MFKKNLILLALAGVFFASCSQPFGTTELSGGVQPTMRANASRSLGEPQIRLYYQTGWTTPYLQYKLDTAPWTGMKGAPLEEAFYSYKVVTLDGSQVEFVVNNGQGQYDNAPGGGNYRITSPGTYYLSSGVVTQVSSDVVAVSPKINLYYKTSWTPANLLYKADAHPWIPLPGKVMDPIPGVPDYKFTQVDASLLEFVLSNGGQGHFDNNEVVVGGGSGTVVIRNYKINFPGDWTLIDGVLTRGAPVPSVVKVEVLSDRTSVVANGWDEANLSARVTYRDGTVVSLTTADFAANGQTLAGPVFTTLQGGSYALTATVAGVVSAPLELTAQYPQPFLNGGFYGTQWGTSRPSDWNSLWADQVEGPDFQIWDLDGRCGILNLTADRNGLGVVQSPADQNVIARRGFAITMKIVSASLPGDGRVDASPEAPVVLRLQFTSPQGTVVPFVRYYNITQDDNSAANPSFELVTAGEWVTRTYSFEDLNVGADWTLTGISMASTGWAREAYVDEVSFVE